MEQSDQDSGSVVFTVGEFLDAVNLVLKREKVWVRGEVTDFKKGKWISFTLKDAENGAILKCVLGSWQYNQIGLPVGDGLEVKIFGQPSISKPYGSFGFWVLKLEPLGQGSLKKAYDLLVKKLEAEGLFARKRRIPEFVEKIGVITSKHGVVIHDFRQNLDPRGYKIYFYDARVEGPEAVEQIRGAIEYFNHQLFDLDVLVLIRGGGSLESMLAFNDERVARAIFGSRIPVIAGIGHEVDVPIASLAADLEESTPTGAAEAINSSWTRLENIGALENQVFIGFRGAVELSKTKARIAFSEIFNGARSVILKFKILEQKIRFALGKTVAKIESLKQNLIRSARMLELANPERNLRLGYSLVKSVGGTLIKSKKQIQTGDRLGIFVSDGEIITKVIQL